jgi:GAF domain-containing protein
VILTKKPQGLSTTEKLALVQRVAERLADSQSLSEVLASVVSAKDELGAAAVTVGLVNEAGSALVNLLAVGVSERTEELLSKPVPLEGGVPATSVLRWGEPLLWSSLQDRDRDYPEYADFPSEQESWAVLPLVVHGSPIGVIALGWSEERSFSTADAALLRLLAHQCAVGVDRARLQEVERSERETLELLGEGTRLMVSALDPDQVVQRLVRLAVPSLAPWCAVYVADRNLLHRVALDVADEQASLTGELPETSAVSTDSQTPLALTFRSGKTRVVSAPTTRSVQDIYMKPQVVGPTDSDAVSTALIVPVMAAGRVIGVMSLVSATWAGAPPTQVRYAAEGLAGRAGVALANARRFQRERLTAALLTQALLPNEVPVIPEFETAARHLPSGAQVAGDWFDVFHLASGQYLIGVGDAAGHGIHAASLMAQLRNSARGLAVGGSSPSGILHGLGLLTVEDDPESFATAVYALLEPADGTLAWASAGHISPILFGSSGAEFLAKTETPPLGMPSVDPPPDRLVRLEPQQGLVLVTDGVVERRGADLAEGLEVLRLLVAQNVGDSADLLAERIVATLCQNPEDDRCLVVLKRIER